jgi:putative ABC transport system substrate-binding protein
VRLSIDIAACRNTLFFKRKICNQSAWEAAMRIQANGIATGGRVNRRAFVLLGAAAVLLSRPALTARKVARIGFIAPGSRKPNESLLDAFRDGLDDLGWAEDNDLVVLDRWAEARTERLPEIARELIGAGIDILVTAGTPATLAARTATATVPIVFVGVGDPVGAGIVNSLAQPGGNATGLSLSSGELIAKRFELLRDLVPGLQRVAVIARNDPGVEQRLLDIRTIADRMGIKVMEFVAATGRGLELAFRWLRSERYDALYVASGPLGPAKRAEIVALAADARLPAIYAFTVFPAAGGLVSFAADETDSFRRAAMFVDRILNGAPPANLPVEPPTRFELAINLKTAQALGLSVPQKVLVAANEVIE